MASVVDKELLNKPKEKYWITYIKQRISNNKNFLGFISGQTGSGKSYSTLRICEDLDSEFTIERVVFSGLELMQLINSGKLKRGSAICFEEVGVEMNAKNWASVTNKMLNYLVQTFRHRGFILIMNSPFMDFVDSSTRKLFHAEFSTIGIDYNTKEVTLKPVLMQYNSRMRKFYYHRLRVITNKGKIPIQRWNVGLPSEGLRKEYEQKKSEFTTQLNYKIYRELEEVNNKGNDKYSLTEIQREVLECLKQGLTVDDIATQRNRAKNSINVTINLLKKKNYDIKPIFDVKNSRKIVRYEVIEPINNINIYDRTTRPSKLSYKGDAAPPIPKGSELIE